jgi:DNA-binding LacI/PurR family transcriptional regulator
VTPSDESVRRSTIVDVAAHAGVSRQTVTRAMHDMPGISADTRERVLRAAEELNYRPSRFGRGLVSQGPPTLGLLVNDLGNAFFPEIAAAVIRESTVRDWNVVISETDSARDPDAVAGELARRADALLGYSLPEAADHALPARMPMVRLDLPLGSAPGAGVRFDDGPALADLASHLADAGARSAAVLDSRTGPISARAQRIRTALARAGIGATVVAASADGTAAQVEEALADGADTLMAWNDVHALEVLKVLRSRGARVPEDVRVAGIDGLALGTLVSPELTTIGVNLQHVAREAMELVDDLYAGRIAPGEERAVRTVPYRLIVRGSA